MTTYLQLRHHVNQLMRKYATELKVYRLRAVTTDFCDEMTAAVTGDNRPKPKPLNQWAVLLQKRVMDRGYRPGDLVRVLDYLGDCVDRRVLPQSNNLLRALLPKAAQRGLIPRTIQEVPF